MQKNICILTLRLHVHVCSQFILHRFRNELARSLTNGNHFSSNSLYDICLKTIFQPKKLPFGCLKPIHLEN